MVSCNSINSPDNLAEMIEISYLSATEITSGQSLSLTIINKSNYCITFPAGYNLKVFANINGEWNELTNLARVRGNKPNNLMSGGNIDSVGFIDALPDISNYGFSHPTDAYVLISGHLCDDENFIIEKEIPFTIVP